MFGTKELILNKCLWQEKYMLLLVTYMGGACGVMVIVVGNGHGDTSSNPGRDWFHFT